MPRCFAYHALSVVVLLAACGGKSSNDSDRDESTGGRAAGGVSGVGGRTGGRSSGNAGTGDETGGGKSGSSGGASNSAGGSGAGGPGAGGATTSGGNSAGQGGREAGAGGREDSGSSGAPGGGDHGGRGDDGSGQGGEAASTSGEGGTGDGSGGFAGELGSGGTGNPAAVGLEASLRSAFPDDNPGDRRCQVLPNGARSYVIGRANSSQTVENGTNGVTFACTVTASGAFTIELTGNNQAVGLPGTFGMSLSGAIHSKTDGTQNTGSLGFRDSYAGLMKTDATTPPCTFEPPTSGGAITQKAGALLTRFTCPLIDSVDSAGDGCRAEGLIAVEYCETGEQE